MTNTLRFGRMTLCLVERALLNGDEPVALGGRAFDLLVALIERRDRVVTASELLTIVWSGIVVEEANVQVQVSALRKQLGSGVISTIPRRGYRFAMPIDDDRAAPSPVAQPALVSGAAASRPRELDRTPLWLAEHWRRDPRHPPSRPEERTAS